MKERREKSWKRRAAAGAVAAAASAGVLVGSAFDSPSDLLAADGADTPPALIESAAVESTDDGARRQRGGVVRRWISAWPMAARLLLGVPLWAAGWGITEALALLWQAALTPLGGKLLSWLLTGAAAAAVSALTAKALFPHTPWKKLLRPRNLLAVAGAMVLLGAIDTVLPLVWKGAPSLSRLLRLLGGAAVVAAACLSLRRRRRHVHPPADEPAPRTAVEQAAMELADGVCPSSR